MFFRKKPKQTKSLLEITKDVFGQSAILEEHYRSVTSCEYSFLSEFGSNFESNYRITGQHRNPSFSFLFPVKLYSFEQDLKIHRYGFLGCILTIQMLDPADGSNYGYSGKPFHAPDEEVWYEVGKYKGVKLFSQSTPLSVASKQHMEKTVSWIENGFSAAFSPRYAFSLQSNTVHIVFWKPELYDFENQLKIISEILDQL